MWRLRTFGGLAIENGRIEAAAATRRRPLALLALLAIAGPRGMRREKVVSLLWPESDEERGRNSLSQALAALRRDMAEDEVVVGTVELRLSPALLQSDVAEFENAIATGDLERAVALYHGPFLDGFFVKDAADFERWTEEQRRRLHQMYGSAIQRLARQADERRESQAAVTWWRRLTSLEPTNAVATLGLMEALVAAGDVAGALQHYRVYEQIVRQDVGVEPEPAVQQFVAGLRMGSHPPPSTGTPRPNDASDAEPSLMSGAPAPPAIMKRRWPSWPMLAAAAGIIVIVLVAFRPKDAPPSANPRRVVVTALKNLTGDSTLDVFGVLAAEVITDGLQRTDLVEVADPATALTVSGDDPRTSVGDARTVSRLAAISGARFVISGHVSREGDSLVMAARIADHGRVVGATEPVRTSTHSPAEAFERVTQRVLGILAVRLNDQLRDVLTPGSTPPPTLPAYAEHQAGLLAYQRQEDEVAVRHFRRAHELDSTFVAPLIWEAFALGDPVVTPLTAPEQALVVEQIARRRETLTALDRHVLDFLEARQRSDVDGQVAAMTQASDLAPRSFWTFQLATSMTGTGRWNESIAIFEQIDRGYGWTHKWPRFWLGFVEALSRVDHERELEIAREARHVLPALLNPLYLEARALGALRRWPEFHRVVGEMRTFPDEGYQLCNLLHVLGMALWTQGDTLPANQLVGEAIAWFRRLPPDVAERSGIRRAYASALLNGNRCDDARPILELLVEEQPREYRAWHLLGACLAHLGERTRAEAVIALLVANADSREWNYMWAAGIAAVLVDKERAVRFLEKLRNRGHDVIFRRFMFKHFDGMMDYAPFLAVTEPWK
jgi:DNA-binding SARP family transcriptional activator/TolB-like protein